MKKSNKILIFRAINLQKSKFEIYHNGHEGLKGIYYIFAFISCFICDFSLSCAITCEEILLERYLAVLLMTVHSLAKQNLNCQLVYPNSCQDCSWLSLALAGVRHSLVLLCAAVSVAEEKEHLWVSSRSVY
ncbi:hypothetical protein NC652_019326 [Populus alba x Populus x berolinensis]|nr:hypothetical protein NC652_019326 [Populus alba x Populus x berolinensis]